MLNKELLLAGGGTNLGPHVILTVTGQYEGKRYFIGYEENYYGSLTRVPWWGYILASASGGYPHE